MTSSITVWFTGLPCSGKTTLAAALKERLVARGLTVANLDGDQLRKGLNSDLGFSEPDRRENIRRSAEVARMLLDNVNVVLAAFVSPSSEDRAMARKIIGTDRFVEVFVDCPLEVCEQRDVKGMYRRARSGEIKNFTGIQASYETPANPDVVISTVGQSVDSSVAELEGSLHRFLNPA